MTQTQQLPTVWDDRYYSEAAPLTSTTKQKAVVQHAVKAGLVDLVSAPEVDLDEVWADIARVHDPVYVEAVRTGEPRELAESQWFRWSPTFAEAVARTWAGHHAAVALALAERRLVVHPVSGAHHAMYRHGAGFCTFNYLVRDLGLKTGILDLDAHYGDGTDAMTATHPAFFHFDVHGGLEVANEKTPRGAWYGVRSRGEYVRALRDLPAWLDTVRPEILHWQAGMDPYEHDRVGGIPGMDARALYRRDLQAAKAILARGIPTVVTLAGGYSEGVEYLHLQTFRAIQQAMREVA